MRSFAVLYVLVAVAFASQQALNPVLAPLARETQLAEWQIGLIISSAAVMVVATSVFWGRTATRVGPRPVLLIAFSVAAGAMGLFAVAALAVIDSLITTELAFVLFLVSRGLLFGAALAAVGPTVQAVVAARTAAGPARVAAIAGIGAAQGASIVLGAAAGAALGALGLLVPLVVIPVVLAVGALMVVLAVPARESAVDNTPAAKVSLADPRVRGFLLAGFLLYSALGFIQLLIGFVVVDRFELASSTATAFTGIALAAAGVGVIIAQAVLVPRLKWKPRRLMIVGSTVAALIVATLIAPLPLWITVTVVGLAGLSIGLAAPGVTAGATLRANAGEQGAIAGLTGAVIASSFIVAPTLSTALYAVAPVLSFSVASVLLLAATAVATLSRGVRDSDRAFG